MRRWLLNLATAAALVLFLAASALWIRSYLAFDRVVYNSTARPSKSQLHLGAESNQDTIAIGYVYYDPRLPTQLPPPFAPGVFHWTYPTTPATNNPIREFAASNGKEFEGFGYFAWSMDSPPGYAGDRLTNYGLVFPHWALALLSGAVAAWGIRRIVRRRRRAQAGRCAACGYDLRATPDRCPECGKVPDAAAAHSPQAT